MTKAITGTAAMQLVEQGKLALDVPISTYIPRAADFQVLEGFDANGDGRVGYQEGEGGLAQAEHHVMLMLNAEKKP
jgi:methyl acetate hydrolase